MLANKKKARAAFCAAVAACLLPSVAAAEDLIHDNGDGQSDVGRCNQSPTGCGGSGNWMYYDDFEVTLDSVITRITYQDVFSRDGGFDDYVASEWSIWAGDPFTEVAPAFSGSQVATVLGPGDIDGALELEIDGIVLPVAPGTYWFGITNVMNNGTIVTPVGVFPPREPAPRSNAKQGDGASNAFSNQAERVFTVYGVIPEPTAVVMLLTALGLAVPTRRSAA